MLRMNVAILGVMAAAATAALLQEIWRLCRPPP
jgi:hypothetical protein